MCTLRTSCLLRSASRSLVFHSKSSTSFCFSMCWDNECAYVLAHRQSGPLYHHQTGSHHSRKVPIQTQSFDVSFTCHSNNQIMLENLSISSRHTDVQTQLMTNPNLSQPHINRLHALPKDVKLLNCQQNCYCQM